MGKRGPQRIPESEHVLVPTSSNWYPCLDERGSPDKSGGHVRLRFCELPLPRGWWGERAGAGGWRVCAWGGDDFGMEKDFPPGKRMEALELFKLVKGSGSISVEDLEGLGFVRA